MPFVHAGKSSHKISGMIITYPTICPSFDDVSNIKVVCSKPETLLSFTVQCLVYVQCCRNCWSAVNTQFDMLAINGSVKRVKPLSEHTSSIYVAYSYHSKLIIWHLHFIYSYTNRKHSSNFMIIAMDYERLQHIDCNVIIFTLFSNLLSYNRAMQLRSIVFGWPTSDELTTDNYCWYNYTQTGESDAKNLYVEQWNLEAGMKSRYKGLCNSGAKVLMEHTKQLLVHFEMKTHCIWSLNFVLIFYGTNGEYTQQCRFHYYHY